MTWLQAPRLLVVVVLIIFLVFTHGCDEQAGIEEVTDLQTDINVPEDSTDPDGLVPDTGGDSSSDTSSDSSADSQRDSADGSDSDADLTAPGCQLVTSDIDVVNWLPFSRMDRLPDPERFRLYTSAEEFEADLGLEPPSEVDFSSRVVVLATYRWWENSTVEVVTAELCPDVAEKKKIDLRIRRGAQGCSHVAGPLKWPGPLLFTLPREEGFEGVSGRFDLVMPEPACDNSLADSGEPCSTVQSCDPGLVCAGLTTDLTGVCTSEANQAWVTSRDSTAIPDSTPGGASIPNPVPALPGVVADVFVSGQIDHPNPSDLEVYLVSPSGTEVPVWISESGEIDELDRAAVGFAGETATGEWSLKGVDTTIGNVGEVDEWRLGVVTRP